MTLFDFEELAQQQKDFISADSCPKASNSYSSLICWPEQVTVISPWTLSGKQPPISFPSLGMLCDRVTQTNSIVFEKLLETTAL